MVFFYCVMNVFLFLFYSSSFLFGFLGFLDLLLALHSGQIGALRWICWWQDRHAWNGKCLGEYFIVIMYWYTFLSWRLKLSYYQHKAWSNFTIFCFSDRFGPIFWQFSVKLKMVQNRHFYRILETLNRSILLTQKNFPKISTKLLPVDEAKLDPCDLKSLTLPQIEGCGFNHGLSLWESWQFLMEYGSLTVIILVFPRNCLLFIETLIDMISNL